MQSDGMIYPPIKARGPGRPAMQRKRGIDEGPMRYGGKKQHRCKNCKQYGHNRLTCTQSGPDHASYVDAKKGATPMGGRPRTRPRKVDYGVPVENIAEDPVFSEFIAQFEPMVPQRASGKGKGKKTYKAKGKKKSSAPQFKAPNDPAVYCYGPTQDDLSFLFGIHREFYK
ncbi:hypothetical protein FRX31_002859 [Thalictrum thalictroides]|uniref:Uncharacterized protein n=1 Tax=Thalictrum thalictroides TaxID=46969 RepID=A0A7J6XF38_THATH|nr:hypothetical protein FRX31_002859 [Thalictrum thalictroides]